VLGLEVELRRAIDQDEFVLYFQPQISIADGRLIGAEALLRWQSPSRGLVSPGLFVPILEATDLIGPVGEWVIRTAAHEAAAWPRSRSGEAMRVAVNVSGHQLVDGRLVEVVSEALANSPLDPSRLEIEVTETAALSQPEIATRVLRALRSMGVHSALDDFGTGQSSLEHIKSLPGDSIKIDRTFVVDIVDDTTDRSIVEAVVSIARSLGRTTVAEGVETEEQFELLRELGCDIAQGYLIGRPMPPSEFRAFIRQWRGLVAVEELEVAVA
jgi:EAL domain-containing protein (putative c-di-GMP-specific phosphodiesterase class I)